MYNEVKLNGTLDGYSDTGILLLDKDSSSSNNCHPRLECLRLGPINSFYFIISTQVKQGPAAHVSWWLDGYDGSLQILPFKLHFA